LIPPPAEYAGPPIRWRDRFTARMRDWAQRRLERRLRAEWNAWRRSSDMEIRPRWFRRESGPQRTQNFRSLVQVNFYRTRRR